MVTKTKPRRKARRTSKQKVARAEALSALGVAPELRLERTRALAAALEREATIRGPQARRLAAEKAATAAIWLDSVLALRDQGALGVEELRLVSTAFGHTQKALQQLGVEDKRLDASDCLVCLGNSEIDGVGCAACGGTGERS